MYTRTIYRHTVLNTISTLCRLLYFVEGLLRPFLYLHRSDKLNLSQKQKTKTSITLWMDRGTKICKCHLSFYPPYKWRLIAAHRVKPSLKRKLLCVISAKKVRKIGPPRSLLFWPGRLDFLFAPPPVSAVTITLLLPSLSAFCSLLWETATCSASLGFHLWWWPASTQLAALSLTLTRSLMSPPDQIKRTLQKALSSLPITPCSASSSSIAIIYNRLPAYSP